MRVLLAAAALLLGLGAAATAGQDDLEGRFQQRLTACKDNGAGAVRVARSKVELGRPRLLSVLPSMDVSRFCECKYEARRSAFGLERALQLDSMAGEQGLEPQGFVELYVRDEQLMLDCIELAATGTRKFSDPAESQLADHIDRCGSDEKLLTAFAVMLLNEKPDQARQRIAGLDRSALCSCFYEGQRAEFGLQDAVGFNAIAGPGRSIDSREADRIMTRKAAIFRACAGGEPKAARGDARNGGAAPVSGSGAATAVAAPRTSRLGAVFAGLVAVAVVGGGTLLYRRRREREQLRLRRQPARVRPSPRR